MTAKRIQPNPGTYTKIYIQIILAVKYRKALIDPSWEEKLHKYITGTIQNMNQKVMAINGVADHIHILIGLSPACSLSSLVREVKKSSNEYINTNGFTQEKFYWQNGFSAFSYGQSQTDRTIRYIMNQKRHHARKSFLEEYLAFLLRFDIEYSFKYIYHPPL